MVKKIESVSFLSCLVLAIVLLQCIPCEAGWLRTYGGAATDSISSVQPTSDGGYIVVGNTNSFGAGFQDAWLLKFDSELNVTWQKTYGGTNHDWGMSVHPTSDGGYIVSGRSASFGAGSDDAWLLKLDGDGNVTWQKTYGGTNYDYFGSVLPTSDGYIVVGYTRSFGAGNGDAWLLKLDGDGNVTWQKTYGGGESESTFGIQPTSDGGYIVAGRTASFEPGNTDAWLLKLVGDGNVTWQKTYGGAGDDGVWLIQPTLDGGYIVAGSTNSVGAGLYDAWLLKLDGDGNVTWQKTYGGAGDDIPESVMPTSDGGYIIVGSSDSVETGNTDAWLLKLDGDGNVTWQKTYGRSGYDAFFSVRQTADDGYVVAGSTNSFGAGGQDAWILKLDENGSTGSCPFEVTFSASVTITAASGKETAVTPGTTSVTGANTAVTPAESAATSAELCPLVDRPLILKTKATRKRQGDGTITSSDGLIDCPDACKAQYNPETLVTLTATPSDLSTFIGWKPTSLGCEGTTPTCTVTMDKKKSVKAVFQGPNKLKVLTTFKNGATGTVTSGDGLINCPTDCEELYILNAPVTLTATAGDGSSFVKWTGRPCKDELTNVCTFTMNKNATVKAIFQANPE